VPETQIVPLGLSTRRQAASHLWLKAWFSSTPWLRSQAPLSTLVRLPARQVVPPLLRK
jgi:hypothetical protein